MSQEIICEKLSKRYQGIKALDELDMLLEITRPTGIVGPNGAGKSTLFSILCGFIRPSSGTVSVLGNHVNSPSIKGRISLLPQDTTMFKGIDVNTQLKHYSRLQGLDKSSAIKEVNRVIDMANAQKFAKQYPETLSFGQRKRVMLAQALIGQPELILLDEPTSGLDPVAATDVRRLLQQLGNEYSLVISSHNLTEIEDICSDIAILNKGKLVIHDKLSKLKRTSQCFSLKLEQGSEANIGEIFRDINEISLVEADKNDSRSFLVHYKTGTAEQIQIKILSLLNDKNIAVSELRKGKALAEEISAILQDK